MHTILQLNSCISCSTVGQTRSDPFDKLLLSDDTESEHVVQQAIDDMISNQRSLEGDPTRAMTVVIVAHRLSTIRSADKIVVIKDGRVAEQGTHEELLAESNVYSGLVRRQLGLSESSS